MFVDVTNAAIFSDSDLLTLSKKMADNYNHNGVSKVKLNEFKICMLQGKADSLSEGL